MKQPLNYALGIAKPCSPIKFVSLEVDVAKPNFPKAVQAAFDLAKSGGRELNLTFTLQASPPSVAKQPRLAATP